MSSNCSPGQLASTITLQLGSNFFTPHQSVTVSPLVSLNFLQLLHELFFHKIILSLLFFACIEHN